MNTDLLRIASSPVPKRRLLPRFDLSIKKPKFKAPEFKLAGFKVGLRLTALGTAIIAGVHGYEALRCYDWFNALETSVGLAPAVAGLMLSTRAAHGLDFWKVSKAELIAAFTSLFVSAGWLAAFNAGGSAGNEWLNFAAGYVGQYPAMAFFVGLQALLLIPAMSGIMRMIDGAGELALQLVGKEPVTDKSPQAQKKAVSRNAEKSDILREWLGDNGFEGVEVVAEHIGHTLETYELELPKGKRVSDLLKLEKDLSRELSGQVRIVPVTYGKKTVSVEVPRSSREFCMFDDVLNSAEYRAVVAGGGLPVVVGSDKYGKPLVLEMQKMPHLLVAGATGTGKSVGLNSIICGLAALPPERIKFVMTDPKFLELNLYNDLPHMLRECMYELHEVEPVLLKLVDQMNKRLRAMAQVKARNISEYNAKCREAGKPELPSIICVIDEFAEMMLEAMKDKDSSFQASVQSLAQKARAAGIHLILATQKPVVKVLDGVIKANIPARIAFQTSTGKDSEVILDQWGAESLIGNGDCLVKLPDRPDAIRAQGAFISTEDVEKFIKSRA